MRYYMQFLNHEKTIFLLLRIHRRLNFDNIIQLSTLQFWVGYFICFKFAMCSFNGFFKWMFFSSAKEINRLLKE